MIVQISNLVEKRVAVKYFNIKCNLNYRVSKDDKKTKGYIICDGETISFTKDVKVVAKFIELEKEECFTFGAFANIILQDYQETFYKLSNVGSIVEHHCVSFMKIFKV